MFCPYKHANKKRSRGVFLFFVFLLCIAFFIGCESESDPAQSFDVAILMYHHLENVTLADLDLTNGAIIAVSQFAEQMAWLADNGYNTLFVSEIIALLNSNKTLPEKTVAITFDDGYESNYLLAYPILKRFNFKASISLIMSKMEWVENDLAQMAYRDPERGYPGLSVLEASEMLRSGLIEFYNHSYNLHHTIQTNNIGSQGYAGIDRAFLPEFNRAESSEEYTIRITNDLNNAACLVSKYFGNKSKVFTFPYGRYNDFLINAAKSLGVIGGLTTKPGYVTTGSDVFLLPRIAILPNDNMTDFISKVTGNN